MLIGVAADIEDTTYFDHSTCVINGRTFRLVRLESGTALDELGDLESALESCLAGV